MAGRVLENDIYLEAAGNYPQAQEALQACLAFNKRVGIKPLIYNMVGVNLAPHGSAFWEKTLDPVFDIKPIPNQECIEPVSADENGEVDRWALRTYSGRRAAEWSKEEVVHFCWMRTTRSYPYGTSLFTGSETELDILEQLEKDIKEHMHRTAFQRCQI